jgi:type III pantothenate kinase
MSRLSKSQLLLAMDIGNTNVVVGVYEERKLLQHWRLATSVSRTMDEAWIILHALCQAAKLEVQRIKGAAISSVVPDLTGIFAAMASEHFGVTPYEVSAETAPSLKIHYRDPSAVGADRICNAVAGYEKHGGPLIIVDFGTATTFDVIGANGDYLGGIITAGIELAVKILHHNAARLPKVQLEFPLRIIADTTEHSIQAGLLYGAVDEMEGLCRRICRELGAEARVIVTGGLSTLIAQKSQMISAVEPFLVLEGLRLLHERHG